jgi:hypothetical protein
MLDILTQRDNLARADREIAEGEARVARQALRVEQWRALGQDTGRPEAVLTEMVRSLDLLREIRAEIQRSIEEIEISNLLRH